jgi:hypothetical protein
MSAAHRLWKPGPAFLAAPMGQPISSQGNTGLTNADRNRGGRRQRMSHQNVTMPIPSGPGFPPIPERNDAVVRKNSLQVRVARYDTTTASDTATGTTDVYIHTPSNRLRLAVYGVIEAVDTSEDPIFGATTPHWSIRSMSKNPKTGRESPLQLAYPVGGTTVVLPDSYELDSAVTLLRVRFQLTGTDFSLLWTTGPVYLICYATWEPNTAIADEELKILYGACHVTPNSAGELIVNRNNPT